jgi:hypothetical protein
VSARPRGWFDTLKPFERDTQAAILFGRHIRSSFARAEREGFALRPNYLLDVVRGKSDTWVGGTIEIPRKLK